MKKNQIRLLESMIEIPSPSGYEEEIAEFIKNRLLQFLPKSKVSVDFQNNVCAVIEGTSNKVVMIDAHLDQVGFVVTNVDRKGFISLVYVGGGDLSILSARDLVILTSKGPVNAVVNRKHAHLVEDEGDANVNSMIQAIVDIGPRSRNKVLSIVKVGDPVVYKPSFSHLRESFYAGPGMDDKTGCFVLLETMRAVAKSKKKSMPTLVFTFSGQEEVYGRKLRPLIKKYNPDLFIEVDVTFATDWEDDADLQREVGLCELCSGPVIYRGVDIDKACFKLISSVARTHKIKTQIQASAGSIGYTATEVTNEGKGIKALILGIPLRNMHTPVEVISMRDLAYTTQLLKEFLLHRNIGKVLER